MNWLERGAAREGWLPAAQGWLTLGPSTRSSARDVCPPRSRPEGLPVVQEGDRTAPPAVKVVLIFNQLLPRGIFLPGTWFQPAPQ